MPLSDRPKVSSNNYYRVTKLAGIWFIPEDYIGTITETDRDGKEFKSHLFKIYLINEEIHSEFRCTDKWLGAFNSFLTQEIENKLNQEEISMSYEILGFGRQTTYKFITKEHDIKPKNRNKK